MVGFFFAFFVYIFFFAFCHIFAVFLKGLLYVAFFFCISCPEKKVLKLAPKARIFLNRHDWLLKIEKLNVKKFEGSFSCKNLFRPGCMDCALLSGDPCKLYSSKRITSYAIRHQVSLLPKGRANAAANCLGDTSNCSVGVQPGMTTSTGRATTV